MVASTWQCHESIVYEKAAQNGPTWLLRGRHLSECAYEKEPEISEVDIEQQP